VGDTVGSATRAWLRHRRTDLRPESIRNYRGHLDSVIRCCGPDLPAADWDRDRCDEWWTAQAHLAARTLRHRLSCIHQWCVWCVRHDLMATDPTVMLPRIRAPRGVPRALTVAQVERLWRCCSDDRTRLAVSLMVHEGLRRGEVARLDWAEVDVDRRAMTVVGKGGHERVLPISTATAALLEGDRRRWGPVLRSRIDGTGLTPGYVAELVTGAMRGAGVPGSPHALRHTAASDALDGGCPIRTVQRFLGHTTVAMTEVYLRRDVGDLAAAVEGRPYRLC